jgi:16S rRNA (guanine527-N7)-methyltransferase
LSPGALKDGSVAQEVAEDAAYAPYLERQESELRDLRASEALLLGDDFPYAAIPGLSREMVERLGRARPATLAAAGHAGRLGRRACPCPPPRRMIGSEAEARAWLRDLPTCDDLMLRRLTRLVELLEAENRLQNLVSASSLQQVWLRHIADSAQLDRFVPRETKSWLDLGTGAGFPGLIIAVLRPGCAVALVEARPRRVDWLSRVVEDLELSNVRLTASRLERVETEKFGAISARAFAPLDRLLGLAARFSTSETVWVLPKGRSAAQELQALTGWNHRFHVEQSLTDAEASVIVGSLIGQDSQQ